MNSLTTTFIVLEPVGPVLYIRVPMIDLRYASNSYEKKLCKREVGDRSGRKARPLSEFTLPHMRKSLGSKKQGQGAGSKACFQGREAG